MVPPVASPVLVAVHPADRPSPGGGPIGHLQRIDLVIRPGRQLDDLQCADLVARLRAAACDCRGDVLERPWLRGGRAGLADTVIALAHDGQGATLGFSVAVVLPVPGVGEVLHHAHTCVRVEARGRGLAHRLASRVVVGYLVTRTPLGRQWVTNVSSDPWNLGTFALHLDDVFPSPFEAPTPGDGHRRIAATLDHDHRAALGLPPGADFDEATFTWRGAEGTGCGGPAPDPAPRDRYPLLRDYYRGHAGGAEGAMVLQVGSFSLATTLTGYLRRKSLAERRRPR